MFQTILLVTHGVFAGWLLAQGGYSLAFEGKRLRTLQFIAIDATLFVAYACAFKAGV